MRNPKPILLLISEEISSSELFSSAPVPWTAGGAEPLCLCQAGEGLRGRTPDTRSAQTLDVTGSHTAQGEQIFLCHTHLGDSFPHRSICCWQQPRNKEDVSASLGKKQQGVVPRHQQPHLTMYSHTETGDYRKGFSFKGKYFQSMKV